MNVIDKLAGFIGINAIASLAMYGYIYLASYVLVYIYALLTTTYDEYMWFYMLELGGVLVCVGFLLCVKYILLAIYNFSNYPKISVGFQTVFFVFNFIMFSLKYIDLFLYTEELKLLVVFSTCVSHIILAGVWFYLVKMVWITHKYYGIESAKILISSGFNKENIR